jgi:glycosyltransferase involved in cell wall biosynthesis
VPGTVTQQSPATCRPDRDLQARKYRVLFIGPGPAPPSPDAHKNLHFHISEFCEGDYISTHWGSAREFRGQSLTDVYDQLGSFRYHPTFMKGVPGPARLSWACGSLLRRGWQLSKAKGAYDAIVAYGPFRFALVGWMLRRLTGAKLVIEVPGPTARTYAFQVGFRKWLRARLVPRYIPAMLRSADALRLYFPNQLDELPPGNYPPAFVFPDLVAVSSLAAMPQGRSGQDGRYALFMGFPFQRKGVDVLIKAFHRISSRHADFSLKIVGHCPDIGPYLELAAGNPRISFLPSLPHEQAMELLAGCTFFVLPSRAEGVPRVLIEAMAAQKAVISTRVHGIPYLVEDGTHGLLVEPDDVEGLASKMELFLDDPDLASRLAREGHRRVLEQFSEECYKQSFRRMMESLVARV